MSHTPESYRVDCNISIVEGLYDDPSIPQTPIGLVYGTTIDPGARHVNANLALADSGTHKGILQRLRTRGVLIDDNDLDSRPVEDTADNSHQYYICGGLNKNRSPRDFYAEGICVALEGQVEPHLALAAELGAKAMLMALQDFYSLNDGTQRSWSSDEFAIIPAERLDIC